MVRTISKIQFKKSHNRIRLLDQLQLFETGVKIHSNLYKFGVAASLFVELSTSSILSIIFHLHFSEKKKKTVKTWTVVGLIINLAPTESCRVGYLEAAGFRHTFLRAKMLGAVGIGQLFLVGMRIKLI